MGIRFFPKINSILNEVEFVEENQSLTQKKIILEQNYVFHEIDFKNKKLNFFFLKSGTEEHASPYMTLLATGCSLAMAMR